MTEVKTPVGVVSWKGQLSPATIIMFDKGQTVSFEEWVGRTNGDCFEWVEDYL